MRTWRLILVLTVAVSFCAAIGLSGPHVQRMTNRYALHGLRTKLVENIPGQLASSTQLNAGGPLERWALRLLPAVPLPVVIWIQGSGLNKAVSDVGGTLNSYASGLNKTASEISGHIGTAVADIRISRNFIIVLSAFHICVKNIFPLCGGIVKDVWSSAYGSKTRTRDPPGPGL